MKKIPVVPCGPFMGTPIAECPTEWLLRFAEWKWIRGPLREAVERELTVRRAT